MATVSRAGLIHSQGPGAWAILQLPFSSKSYGSDCTSFSTAFFQECAWHLTELVILCKELCAHYRKPSKRLGELWGVWRDSESLCWKKSCSLMRLLCIYTLWKTTTPHIHSYLGKLVHTATQHTQNPTHMHNTAIHTIPHTCNTTTMPFPTHDTTTQPHMQIHSCTTQADM